MTKRRTMGAIAALAVLAGCGNGGNGTAATTTPPATAETTASSTAAPSLPAPTPSTTPRPVTATTKPVYATATAAQPTSSTSGVPVGDDDEATSPTTHRAMVLDAAAKADAVNTGTRVMRLFARRHVSAATWWSDLAPLLTPRAQNDYQGTDPANVPPQKITGTAKVTPSSIPLVARVSVPTDMGIYLVILTRSEDEPQWHADQIVPPEVFGGD